MNIILIRKLIDKINVWGAKPIYIPQALLVLIALFVVVLMISAMSDMVTYNYYK